MEPTPSAAPTLGPTPVVLTAPSLSERWAVELAMLDVAGRTDLIVLVYAAALGLCDRRLRGFLPRYAGDVRAYGTLVVDYLLAIPEHLRPTMAQIIDAGRAARKVCEASVVTEAAVKAAEDFTAPPPVASIVSPETSNGGGGWTLAG